MASYFWNIRKESLLATVNSAAFLAVVIVGLSSLLLYLVGKMHGPRSDVICWPDATRKGTIACQPVCSNGTFGLPGMLECHPWLDCSDIDHSVSVKELIVDGVVKRVYLALWKGRNVVLSNLTTLDYADDFQHNLQMLKAFHGSRHINQLLGHCRHTLITQFHPLGSALNADALLKSVLRGRNDGSTRLGLCRDYVGILAFLHDSPEGTRVMCDSSSLEKTLSQYLLTDGLRLVLNDLDALPLVDRSRNDTIHCGSRPLMGDFVAPEQRWTTSSGQTWEPPPGYDEKTDIWKIPDVCRWFLGNEPSSEVITFHLFKIHKMCKINNPSGRPTASMVLEEYEKVINWLNAG